MCGVSGTHLAIFAVRGRSAETVASLLIRNPTQLLAGKEFAGNFSGFMLTRLNQCGVAPRIRFKHSAGNYQNQWAKKTKDENQEETLDDELRTFSNFTGCRDNCDRIVARQRWISLIPRG